MKEKKFEKGQGPTSPHPSLTHLGSVWNAGFFSRSYVFSVKLNWFLWNSYVIPMKFLRFKHALKSAPPPLSFNLQTSPSSPCSSPSSPARVSPLPCALSLSRSSSKQQQPGGKEKNGLRSKKRCIFHGDWSFPIPFRRPRVCGWPRWVGFLPSLHKLGV